MLSSVDEIKIRLDIVDFISTYVQLKRAGANFKALCPFHTEKTPSFMISKAKQMWYCFGCNEGGDIFKFLMKMEGLDFPEALKILADKAGVELPKYDKRLESQKNTLLEILRLAVEFYSKQLHAPAGQSALNYLQRRGLSENVINQFALGYAPDSWDALTNTLRARFKPEDIFAAGLVVKKNRDVSNFAKQNLETSHFSSYYDRFRHRIMFPIRDVNGNAVGFTSRLLDEKRAEGKYINTPETMLYNKSRVLYGLDLARQAMRQLNYAVIVEGNMDVIACHQFGMSNVVAASGTAMTIDHLRLLKRYTNNLAIAFDADPAGVSAAKRGIDLALQEGMRVKIITIPKDCGKDPDECIRKNKKAWAIAVGAAREVMDYYLERATRNFDIKTAKGKSDFANLLMTEIKKLPDLIEQDFWLKKVAEALRVDDKLLREQMARVGNAPQPPLKLRKGVTREVPAETNMRPRAELLSERLLALFLAVPQYAESIIEAVLPEMFCPAGNQDLYTQLVQCYTAYNSQGSASAGADFSQFWHNWCVNHAPELSSTAAILELYKDKEFAGWDDIQLRREKNFLTKEIRREYLHKRRFELTEAMRQAEKEDDKAQVAELTREFEALAAQE
ncbi:MAG: primase protein [Parcubacteria group bacterium GW2011_GWC2_45_7]|nr:MAG: primase protein [Parcubacteria group bacterium GW2011_GWC2_45_7]KKU73999.1 MAG: primase protein [Parcubacteria group bacterium GW2011_GWA2_47_26]